MMNKFSVKDLTMMALFAALCYIGTMFNFKIVVGGMKTMIHFGNIFCILGALMLGGTKGGISASVGMGLYDMLNGWLTSAPSTIILKFCMAIIAGTIFKKLKNTDIKYRLVLSTLGGVVFNIIFSPIFSYIKNVLLGFEDKAAKAFAAWSSLATVINAAIVIVIVPILYLAIRKTKAIELVE